MFVHFLLDTIGILRVYYNYKFNVLVYTNTFIWSFLPLCTVLVYHGYTNANTGPWLVGTRLNNLPSTSVEPSQCSVFAAQENPHTRPVI